MNKLFIACFIFAAACKKGEVYRFSDADMNYTNYGAGQELVIRDTSGAVHDLVQQEFRWNLELSKSYMGTDPGNWFDHYRVSYQYGLFASPNYFSQEIYRTEKASTLEIFLDRYQVISHSADTLTPRFQQLNINGTVHSNVFVLRAQKAFSQDPNDTAQIYHNRRLGFLQMVFPNGKTISRIL